MSVTTSPLFAPGRLLAEADWLGSIAVVLGLTALVLMAWQMWTAQQQYAIELAEQARQLADEQEKAHQSQLEKMTVTRESQAKSEMLATLSREIRSHLNGIIGSADLMLDHSLKPQQRENLATLRASAESLHQSLNDVLDFSSIDTGQIQIARQPFDLRQPLIDVVETLSPLALLKKLELVLIIAPDVPLEVSGDAMRVRQVLFNLMSNAVKFTAHGRVVLRVELPQGSAAATQQGAVWLHFSVTDTGAGISEDMQATIFERSAKTDGEFSRKFSGSGLELTISKRLVELMGGQIGARGLPEGGTEFWVTLALAVAEEEPQTVTPAGDMHVVVLDDLAASRIAASAMLTRLGVEQDATDTVTKAEGLLREAREADGHQPVLLLDESLARQSADTLARLVALDSPLRAVRVVLMSKNPDGVAPARLGFPVAAILRKPLLRPELLLEALRAQPDDATVRPPGSVTPFGSAGEVKPGVRSGPHVLVVDDDAISRSVSSQLLERLGCIVEVALNGSESVELARGTRFELIFMDCHMPGMDGFVATEKIRANAGTAAPPIVALTANISEADRERCFAAGMCDFVGKPVKRAELARVLKRWASFAPGEK